MQDKLEKTENRLRFEAMSFFDLLEIADSYDIDVPENLDRNFLVAELIAVSEEMRGTAEEQKIDEIHDEDLNHLCFDDIDAKMLPKSYNMNDIDVVMRSPVWAFVFWNVSKGILEDLKDVGSAQCSFVLRVCFFENFHGKKITDSFDTYLDIDTREQYIFLPPECKYFAVELGLKKNKDVSWLCQSRIVKKISADSVKKFSKVGTQYEMSEIIELSGGRALVRNHYMNHRQVFE